MQAHHSNHADQSKPTPSQRVAIWSISMFTGPALSNLKPLHDRSVPILSAKNVDDATALFVADPFMINVAAVWYMFFEVLNADTRKGEIGLATSKNGLDWSYDQIVLSEPFHLSYPYVFHVDGEYFLIPESYQANSIRLYRASSFPTKWLFIKNILDGPWVDSSLFWFDGMWWMFSNPAFPENQILELFYASEITGPWHRHPRSPLITGNIRLARLGGRTIVHRNVPIRFAQNCAPHYGTAVRAFDITCLTTVDYMERELNGSPILRAGHEGWRQSGMHHIDPHLVNGNWLACVDGWRFD